VSARVVGELADLLQLPHLAILASFRRPTGVAIGVDSHNEAVLTWIQQRGPERVVGIEGSGSYGAGLVRRLLEAGEDVREVPAFLTHRERKKNPSLGKSDVNDAVAIARVVARGDGLSPPQRSQALQDLKLLTRPP
jgi:transposase